MNCQEFASIREAWRDGELEETAIRQAQAHLDQCPRCAASWKAESRWLHALGREDDPLASEGRAFAQRLAARREATGAGRAIAAKISGWRWVGAAAAAVAIGSLLAAMAVWLNGPGMPEQPQPDPLGMLVRHMENVGWPQPQILVGGMQKVKRAISLQGLADAMAVPWLDPAPWKNRTEPVPQPDAVLPTGQG